MSTTRWNRPNGEKERRNTVHCSAKLNILHGKRRCTSCESCFHGWESCSGGGEKVALRGVSQINPRVGRAPGLSNLTSRWTQFLRTDAACASGQIQGLALCHNHGRCGTPSSRADQQSFALKPAESCGSLLKTFLSKQQVVGILPLAVHAMDPKNAGKTHNIIGT